MEFRPQLRSSPNWAPAFAGVAAVFGMGEEAF